MLLSVPEAMEDLTAMKRLWVHEVLRVYYDRLVDDSDRAWIVEALRQVCKEHLEEDLDEMFKRLASPDSSHVSFYRAIKDLLLTFVQKFR